MRLVSRTRSPLSSSWVRVHSRSSTTTGADACTRRRHCGSVRSAEASTRASRRSSLAPAGEYRSRNRSSCFGLIACTARPCASKLSTTGPRGVSIATPTVSDDAAAPGPSRLAFITICGAGGERAGTSPAPTAPTRDQASAVSTSVPVVDRVPPVPFTMQVRALVCLPSMPCTPSSAVPESCR